MYLKIVKGKLFYHINLMGENHKIIMASETYYNKGNANRAAKRVAKVMGIEVNGV